MSLVNVGVGVSQKDDLIQAAKEAAETAKKELGGKKPKLLMFYCLYTYPSEKYKEALGAIYDVFGDRKVPLVGGTVMGFFAKDKYYFDINIIGGEVGRVLKKLGKIISPLKFSGVLVTAIHSNFFNVGAGIGQNAFHDPEKAGRDCINMALDNLSYNPAVSYLSMIKKGGGDLIRVKPLNGFLITPGTDSEKFGMVDQQILDGITSITKQNLKLIGGGGARNFDLDKGGLPDSAIIFFNGSVYQSSVIAVVFGSDLDIGYGTDIGIDPLEWSVITKVKDRMICEINNKPAIDFISEMIKKYSDIKKEEFIKFPILLEVEGYTLSYPDPRASDSWWPVMVVSVIDGKCLLAMHQVREGMGICFARLSKDSMEKAAGNATQMMLNEMNLAKQEIEFLMFFSCALRGQILAKEYSKEIERIKKILRNKNTPIIGIVSVGESAFSKNGPLTGTALTFTIMGISSRLSGESDKKR